MNLIEKGQFFVKHGGFPKEQLPLLVECLDANNLEALSAVKLMFEDTYGGFTYNIMPKTQAAYCLLNWQEKGLDALFEGATTNPDYKNISLALELFVTLSAGQILTGIKNNVDQQLIDRIVISTRSWESVQSSARKKLNELVMWFDNDDEAANFVGVGLMKSSLFANNTVSKEIFLAFSSRWLTVSSTIISEYRHLIDTKPTDEPAFQKYFELHPQILDPMCHQIWSQPDFHGIQEPDFVIRRTDDTYVVVEIECPSKLIVTAKDQISAKVTYAVTQVMKYRNFLMENFMEAQKYFPNLREVECLVIIGRQNMLNNSQQRILKLENEHRHGMRIVGFDWIADRAESISKNIIRDSIQVQNIRVV